MSSSRSYLLKSVDFEDTFYRARVSLALSESSVNPEDVSWEAIPRVLFITCRVEKNEEGNEIENPWLSFISRTESEEDGSPEPMIRLCVREIVNPEFFDDSLIVQMPFTRAFLQHPSFANRDAENEILDDSNQLFLKFITMHDFRNVQTWVTDYTATSLSEPEESTAATVSEGTASQSTSTSESASAPFTSLTSVGSVSAYSESVFSHRSGQSYRLSEDTARSWSPREVFEFIKDLTVTCPWPTPHSKKGKTNDGERVFVTIYEKNTATKLDQLLHETQLMELDVFLSDDSGHGICHLLEALDANPLTLPTLVHPNQNLESEDRIEAASAVFVRAVTREVFLMDYYNRGRFDRNFHALLSKVLSDRDPCEHGKTTVNRETSKFSQTTRMATVEKEALILRTSHLRKNWDSKELQLHIMFILLFGRPFTSLRVKIDKCLRKLRSCIRELTLRNRTEIDENLNNVRSLFSKKSLNLEDFGIADSECEQMEDFFEVEHLSWPLWRTVEMFKAKKRMIDAGINVGGLDEEALKERFEELSVAVETAEKDGSDELETLRSEMEEQFEVVKACARYLELKDSPQRSMKFLFSQEPKPSDILLMEEFAMSPKRTEVLEKLITMATELKIPENHVMKIPVHISVSTCLADNAMQEHQKFGSFLSVFYPIAQRLFKNPGWTFGYTHSAITIGMMKFEYLGNGYVRFGKLRSESVDDNFREYLAAPVTCNFTKTTRSNFGAHCLALAQAVAHYNAETRYAQFIPSDEENTCNCQLFVLDLMKKSLGCEEFPDYMSDFVWNTTRIALSGVSHEEVLRQSMRFEGLTMEYKERFGRDPNFASMNFRRHYDLDNFVDELQAVCDLQGTFPVEYEFLQALDRAFWLHDYRGEAVLRENTCPFVKSEDESVREQLNLPLPVVEEEEEENEGEGEIIVVDEEGESSDDEEDDDDDDDLDALLDDSDSDDDEDERREGAMVDGEEEELEEEGEDGLLTSNQRVENGRNWDLLQPETPPESP